MSAHPIPAALAVVLRGDQVLLVQRANPPDAGLWGFPGGKQELGETIREAALRELAEETGVQAQAGGILDVVEAFDRAPDGTVRRHFAMVAVLCLAPKGDPVADDDALDVRWVPLAGLGEALPLSRDVARIARLAAGAARV